MGVKMRHLMRRYFTIDIVARVMADLIIVNVGFLSGLLTRLFGFSLRGSLAGLDASYVPDLLSTGPAFSYWALLLSAICLGIFSLSGFYTRGRFYQSRYKIVVIVQAISLAYLLFGFLTFFVPALQAAPRSALIAGWVFTTILSLGARFWGNLWRRTIRLEDRLFPAERPTDPIQNVLVIGGAGYIGSVLCRQLLEQGYRVRVLDALLYGGDAIQPLLSDQNFTFIQGDSRDIEAVVRAMWNTDAVVHLGEIVGDPATALDEQLTHEINVAATRMVAQAAKGARVKRFIYASSCSVYGASEGTSTEQSELNPVSIYARAKIAAEQTILALNDTSFSPTILRFATVYGISFRPRFDLVVNLLAAKATTDGQITIFGGDQWRPFVHVGDVARAILRVIEAPLPLVWGEVYNVGSNEQNYTIRQIGEIIHALVPNARVVQLAADSDRRNYRVDFSKVAQRLGFIAQHTVAGGVAEIREAIHGGKVDHYGDRRYSNYLTLCDENGNSTIHSQRISELYAIPLGFAHQSLAEPHQETAA